MSEESQPKPDLGQKLCPACGKRAIKIAKDKFQKRTCECGETWYFDRSKVKNELS